MVLKLRDVPKMLSIGEADRIRAKYDPYRLVSRIFVNKDYDKLARLLKRQVEYSVREATAIPPMLLHSPNLNYSGLCNKMKRRNAIKELIFCARVAVSLAREFHDSTPNNLEIIAQQYDGNPGAMVDLAPYYKGEFKHFYTVYRHYGNRQISA